MNPLFLIVAGVMSITLLIIFIILGNNQDKKA